MAVVCAIVEAILEHKGTTRGEYWFLGDNLSGDNPDVNGLITFGYGFPLHPFPCTTLTMSRNALIT